MRVIDSNPDPRFTAPIKPKLTPAQRDSIPVFIEGKSSIVFDPALGWLHAEPYHVRTTRQISPVPGQGELRIAAFGDSFTRGDEVGSDETFSELLATIDPSLDSLNMGVSRFGLDQAYLTYLKHGVPLKPHVVLICFMPENILRQVNVFRPFYAQADTPPLTKPRFELNSGKLVKRENPFRSAQDYNKLLSHEEQTLRNLGAFDFFAPNYKWNDDWESTPGMRLIHHLYYTARKKIRLKKILTKSQYRDDSEALRITTALFESFSEVVKDHGGKPVIVILPRHQDLSVWLETGESYYAPLLELLQKRKLTYVDAREAFADLINPRMNEEEFRRFRETHFMPGEHYSAAGHRRVAEYLYQKVLKNISH